MVLLHWLLHLAKVAKDLSKVEFFNDFGQPHYTGQFKASVYTFQNTWGKKSEKDCFCGFNSNCCLLTKCMFLKIVIGFKHN